ncbi:MAG: GIY-YIG nuclease family protein [Patescibacteria group bacterium]|nr:GIY-YIG nuclease family protein [Patescibacteria group bacterium]
MFATYVIYNKDKNKIYIGQTANLKQRLDRHNNKLPNKTTSFTSKNKGRWLLVHKEYFAERKQAINREKELKSAQGRKFIQNLIINKPL